MLFTVGAQNVIIEQVDLTFLLIRISGRLRLDKGLTQQASSNIQIACVTVSLPTSSLQTGGSKWLEPDKPVLLQWLRETGETTQLVLEAFVQNI